LLDREFSSIKTLSEFEKRGIATGAYGLENIAGTLLNLRIEQARGMRQSIEFSRETCVGVAKDIHRAARLGDALAKVKAARLK